MFRIVAAICLFLTLTPSVFPQTKRQSWLNGTWEGTGYQIDEETTWTMSLRVSGKTFEIEYTSLNCGGIWKLTSIDSGKARFTEIITSNVLRCANNGNVVIERLNRQQVAFRYSYTGTKEVSASAILNRKK